MKFRGLILATTPLTAATGFAFAQSAPSPTNSSGPDVHANTAAPTDMSGDNIKGIPSRGTAAQRRATTGAGMTEPASRPTARKNIEEGAQKNASPASPAEGVEKEK
jgi:hypothetical protein